MARTTRDENGRRISSPTTRNQIVRRQMAARKVKFYLDTKTLTGETRRVVTGTVLCRNNDGSVTVVYGRSRKDVTIRESDLLG